MTEKIKWEGDVVLMMNGCPVQTGRVRVFEGSDEVLMELEIEVKSDGAGL